MTLDLLNLANGHFDNGNASVYSLVKYHEIQILPSCFVLSLHGLRIP